MLKVNVGLSRKVTEDYNSQGFSLNIEGELPSDVLNDSDALAESTNRIFDLANALLDEQVRKATNPEPDIRSERNGGNGNGHSTNGNGNGRTYSRPSNGNGNGGNGHNGNGHNGGERLLTQAQFRAITNMARKVNVDADLWARDEFGVSKVGELTVKQASEAIDLLKQQIEAGAKEGDR